MPKSAAKEKKAMAAKIANLKRLLAFDRSQIFNGRSRKPQCFLVGTDEVGRGCLAGPVVAAAVMLPEFDHESEIAQALIELNDSKKLTALQRERLAKVIQEIALWAIDQASVEEINEINILHASLRAMKRALDKLSERIPDTLPVLVLVDGNKAVKNIEFKYVQSTVIKGDSTSASIAAASIIAKVYRDRMMMDLAEKFPAYNWEQNKGYGSRSHRDALRSFGMTEWHRKIFCEKHLSGEYIDEVDDESDYAEVDSAAELVGV